MDAARVIELPASAVWEDDDPVAKERAFFAAIWFSLSRKVRRAIFYGGRFMNRMLNKIPPRLRFAIKWAAAFTGWFVAWMLFYISIIIAFSYSLALGIGIIFLYGVLAAYVIEVMG